MQTSNHVSARSISLPKMMALAAAGSVAVVGVLADMDAMAPKAMDHEDHEDHDGHDHGAMMMELKALGYKGYMAKEYIPEDAMEAVAVRPPSPPCACPPHGCHQRCPYGQTYSHPHSWQP